MTLAASLRSARELGIAVFLLGLVVLISVQQTGFLSGENLRSVLLDVSLIAVLACGELAVLLTRNFDLSVGATVGISAMGVGMLFKAHAGMSPATAYVLAIVIGLAVGVINGTLISWLGIPSIIFTLGMLSVLRGVVYLVAGGSQVNAADVPDGMVAVSQTSPIGIPVTVLIAAAVCLVAFLLLRWTRTGRSVFALGSNPDAAVLHGLPVHKITLLVFAVSGAAAGLAGAMYVSRFGFVQISAGTGLELIVIAAVVVGGASIFGGSGSVLGTVLGCLLLGVIANGLAVLNVSAYWQSAVTGALILLAVLADAASRRPRAPVRGIVDAEAPA